MHDVKGRLIEVGDVVLVKDWNSPKLTVKKVAHCFPGSDTCNIGVFDFETRYGQQSYNAKDSEIVLKHDGTLPVAEKEA